MLGTRRKQFSPQIPTLLSSEWSCIIIVMTDRCTVCFHLPTLRLVLFCSLFTAGKALPVQAAKDNLVHYVFLMFWYVHHLYQGMFSDETCSFGFSLRYLLWQIFKLVQRLAYLLWQFRKLLQQSYNDHSVAHKTVIMSMLSVKSKVVLCLCRGSNAGRPVCSQTQYWVTPAPCFFLSVQFSLRKPCAE
jgi:hypothetical protein